MKFFRSRKDRAQSQVPENSEEAGASSDTPPSDAEVTPDAATQEADIAIDSSMTDAESVVSVQMVDGNATQPGGAAASPAEESESSAPTNTATSAATTETPKEPGFFGRLKRGLGRTSDNLVAGIGTLFLGKKEIDADLLEELESQLIMADVGIEATADIVSRLTDRVSRKELADGEALLEALQQELHSVLAPCEAPLDVSSSAPFVILVVGVNGVGKTTTIGKMARRFKDEGRSVMLAAGDTFRAAAVEQLQHWGERNDVPLIAQHTGADSASVIYDALQAATARNVDVLIADTAGRLQNKSHLMDELSKVVRVMGKISEYAPHEVMLVLDAGTGQNALAQATQFGEVVGVTGVTLTKLDGTAKGGVIFAIAQRLKLPIRFIGVGESAEDLRPFVASDFIRALFQRS